MPPPSEARALRLLPNLINASAYDGNTIIAQTGIHLAFLDHG